MASTCSTPTGGTCSSAASGGRRRRQAARRDRPGRRLGAHRRRRRLHRRRHGRARRRGRRPGRVGRDAAARPRRDPAHAPSRCSPTGPMTSRELMSLEMGKTDRRGQGRGDLRRGVLPLVRRGGGPDPRPLDARPGRRQPAAHGEEAGGAVPVRHPVELPARDGHPQDRAGRGGRLHDGDQAGRADPADDAGPGRRCWPRPGCPTAYSTW